MPIHRQTLIVEDELEQAHAELSAALEDLRAEAREGDVEAALARLDELRRRADDLEQVLVGVEA